MRELYSMFGGAYGDARMPNWPHWHRTPLPGIATTGLRRNISVFTSDYETAARIYKLRIIHFSNIRILSESYKCGKESLTEQEPPPPTFTLLIPLPPRTPLAAGKSSACIGKCCICDCRHRRATPVPLPCHATIYFRCIFRDAPVF